MRSALLVVACAAAATGARADGMLDPAFGTGGIVKESIAASDSVFGMVLTPAGEIVAAGTSSSLITNFSAMVAMRLLPAGAPDPSFGTNGRVVVEFPPPADAMGTGLALQADGKAVIVGGMIPGGSAFSQVAVVRLDSSGSLDTSFGVGGRVLVSCFGGECRASRVALQPDGRIVVAVGDDGAGGRLMRFLTDGALDPSFATSGVAAFPPAWGFFASDVQVRDGRIVVGGTVGGPPSVRDLAAARFLADGTPDTTFGGDGLTVFAAPGDRSGRADLIVQESGAVLVGGTHLPGVGAMYALVRFLSDGTPDAGFGAGGLATAGSGFSGAILELPNGKLMQAGSTPGPIGSTPDVALMRYLADGTVDATFGAAGILTTDLGGQDFVGSLAYAGPERLVLGGTSEVTGSPTQADFAFARYIAATPVALQSFAIE